MFVARVFRVFVACLSRVCHVFDRVGVRVRVRVRVKFKVRVRVRVSVRVII